MNRYKAMGKNDKAAAIAEDPRVKAHLAKTEKPKKSS